MRRLMTVAAGAALLLLTAGDGFVDQYECEEAVAHLKDCCGSSLGVTLHCGEGCNPVDIPRDTASCLRRTSCDVIVSQGVCPDPKAIACE